MGCIDSPIPISYADDPIEMYSYTGEHVGTYRCVWGSQTYRGHLNIWEVSKHMGYPNI